MRLAPIDYAVLAVAASSRRGVTYYQLKSQIEAGTAPLLGYRASRARTSLQDLAREQYLNAYVVDPGDLPQRAVTRYTLAPDGQSALQAWAETAPQPPPVNSSELLVRLRAAPLVGTALTIASLDHVSELLNMQLRGLTRPQTSADSETAARLEYDLQHTLLWSYLQWLDRAIGELRAEGET